MIESFYSFAPALLDADAAVLLAILALVFTLAITALVRSARSAAGLTGRDEPTLLEVISDLSKRRRAVILGSLAASTVFGFGNFFLENPWAAVTLTLSLISVIAALVVVIMGLLRRKLTDGRGTP
jgi:hypothetical protein